MIQNILRQKPMVPSPLPESFDQYPYYMQPKLDGFRCLSYYDSLRNRVIFQSLRGKEFEHTEQFHQLLFPFFKQYPHIILDGELYRKGATSHTIQHEMAQKNPNVMYMIFDMYNVSDSYQTFSERWSLLQSYWKRHGSEMSMNQLYIVLLPTTLVHNRKERDEVEAMYVKENMEGFIVRLPDGLYEWNKRSRGIYKSKRFYMDLFKIVGMKEGKGQQQGVVIFKLACLIHPHQTFWAPSTGTIEERRKIYREGEKYVGKKVWVKYYLMEGESGCVSRNPIVLLEKGFSGNK